MRGQMRTEMRCQVRGQKELMVDMAGRRTTESLARSAGQRLLRVYAALARRNTHLLEPLLAGQPPVQWAHYPDDDAIDEGHGYQWFYHSHSPEDRPDSTEHGHFHLFARRKLWSRRLQSAHERAFARLAAPNSADVNTRHLLCIGLNAKGIPISLFTVNSWVTGDLMLSALNTEALLAGMKLKTGHAAIDTMLECVIALCRDDIRELLLKRDNMLFGWKRRGVLTDKRLELLSATAIDLDDRIHRYSCLSCVEA